MTIRPFKALTVAAVLLGTTAIFEPGVASAQDFSGIIGMAMRHYGAYSGHGRSGRHASRRESRHASRHREGRSRETGQNETPPASEEATTKSASSSTPPKANDGPNFTPAR